MRRRADLFFYAFLTPLLLTVLLLTVFPLAMGGMLSIYERDKFVGLAQYIRLYNDPNFWHSLKITFLYVAIYGVGVFFVGFVTAITVDASQRHRLKGHQIIDRLITIPYAIPDVVAALVWTWMFDLHQGIANYALSRVGLRPVEWLLNPSLALYSVVIVTVWRTFPFHTLVILASFRTIPQELYEAAELDGANGARRFVHITLPLIRNVMVLLVLLTVIWTFRRFALIWLLTGGGPARATEVGAIVVYVHAFRFFEQNYASAIAIALLIVVAAISAVYMRLMMQRTD